MYLRLRYVAIGALEYDHPSVLRADSFKRRARIGCRILGRGRENPRELAYEGG